MVTKKNHSAENTAADSATEAREDRDSRPSLPPASIWKTARETYLRETGVIPRIELRRFAGPAAFADQMQPIRVAHLTDLHFGRVTPVRVQRAAVRLALAEKPDIVIMTGDFVCHSQLYLDELVSVLSEIQVPSFAVLGNHDHWSGSREVRRALRLSGAEVLDNVHTVTEVRGQKLQIVGLDDAYTGHAHREDAIKGMRHDIPTIALSHIAEEADGLWRHGVPMVFSGHTHGGQITFAKLHELALGRLVGHRYVHGLYGSRSRAESSNPHAGAVYVGAGVGAAVIPLRLGDRGRREVALFELGQAPGSFDEHHSEQASHPGRKPSPEKRDRRKQAVIKAQARRDAVAERNVSSKIESKKPK